jgi:hypothetical protein
MTSMVRKGSALMVAVLATTSCTSILGTFDFSGPPSGSGGAGEMASSASQASTSASSSSTSSGGCMGAMTCTDATTCPPQTTKCVTPTCTGACCGTTNTAASTLCAENGGSVCDGDGKCVGCLMTSDCQASTTVCATVACTGEACVSTNVAMGMKCTDNGGSVCSGNGKCVACNVTADCATGMGCVTNKCVPASCSDGVQDGTETDVDCGGPVCAACAPGRMCKVQADCTPGICKSGVCAAPTCTDGVQDGTETDVDCGGSCTTKCADRKHCAVNGDCLNNNCFGGVCVSCMDGVKDGTETDVDCGGACITKCADSLSCVINADCENNDCFGGTCISCMDGVKDGTETDVDCGGADCDAQGLTCAFGKACVGNADCASTFCVAGACGASVLYTSPSPTLDPLQAIAIDSVSFYVATLSKLTQIPINGTAPLTLLSNGTSYSSIAVGAQLIYVADRSTNIITGVVAGQPGPGITIASGSGVKQPVALMYGPGSGTIAQRVFWVSAMDGSISWAPAGGGMVNSVQPAATVYTTNVAFTIDQIDGYWTNGGDTLINKQNLASTATPQQFLPNPARALANNGSTIFWVDGKSGVFSAPKAGGATTTITTTSLAPYRVVVDATNVYWLGGTAMDSVYKSPIGGGGPVTVLASNQPGAVDLVVANTYVYWISQGDSTLKKVHK